MILKSTDKSEIIDKFKIHEKDTGSSNVQVALLTKRINDLTDHFKLQPKDRHSRRGLVKMVGQRRHLLNYVKRNDANKYLALIKNLGLRK